MSFLKFHEWGAKYGDIIGLKIGQQNVVVLNHYKHVAELFDKRGANYADRPRTHITHDILFPEGLHLLFADYGPTWRFMRKAMMRLLNTKVVDTLLPIQTAESLVTMQALVRDPEEWYNHIQRYSTAVILASVFGLRGTSFDSPRVKDLYATVHELTNLTEMGSTPPIDIFPFLKLLPDFMSPWRTRAQNLRIEYRRVYNSLVDEGKENLQREDAPDCFLKRLLDDAPETGLSAEQITYVCGAFMEGGSDTTASAMLSFILAMAAHPHIQRKAQREVDSKCGLDKSPTAEDGMDLPYLRAIHDETLRWRPVAPGGIPHAAAQDDWYNGYFIPKGTILFANTWSIHRTDEFRDPDSFIPERFVDNTFGTEPSKVQGDDQSQRRVNYTFGAGRRVCSGMRMAANSLILNMAKVLWTFDLVPENKEKPINTDVTECYKSGILVFPKKFPVKFVPRSDARAMVIEREVQDVQPFLSNFKQ
ncbi:uncharacterized protein LTR77_000257 [Saxophila tyrrhenica]|uniref:Cytochrome P450 n=1 Tax=Saxophila tyrrhenica TaxID=1690608 RepID=A0AAV9PQS3_9PEZI|nr:hypothetical protein LTR77_000257 [Saxophila tyrrhenica]